jgi:hypothetical protein
MLLLLFVALVFGASNLVVVEVHSCLDASLTLTEPQQLLRFEVTLPRAVTRNRVPVFDFVPYSDGTLALRSSCGNLPAELSLAELLSAASEQSAAYAALLTQHGWKLSITEEQFHFSVELSREQLVQCSGPDGAPVISTSSADGALLGVLYVGLAEISLEIGDQVRFLQPHPFSYTGEGEVSLAGMRYDLELEWAGATWTPNGDLFIELRSTLSTADSDAVLQPHVVAINAVDNSLSSVGQTTCEESMLPSCVQSSYFRTNSNRGVVRLLVQLSEIGTLFSALLHYEIEQTTDSGDIVSQLFSDTAFQQPYIVNALDTESNHFHDGDTACFLLQDSRGQRIEARAARICSSSSGLLRTASDGATDGGCNTPGLSDIVESVLFDQDRSQERTDVRIFELTQINQQAFCFTVQKLSENNHILEVQYYQDQQQGKRGLLSFEWDSHSHDDMWVDCPDHCEWVHEERRCSPHREHHEDGWLWPWLIIAGAVALLCCAGIWCYNGGWFGSGSSFSSMNQVVSVQANCPDCRRLGRACSKHGGGLVAHIHKKKSKK